VEGVPSWLKEALRKRIDVLGQHMHVKPAHHAAWKRTDALFEGLKSSFSEGQLQQFVEWEDCMSLQVSKEKEEMYVRGLWDGYQLYASLDESLSSIPDGEQYLNKESCP